MFSTLDVFTFRRFRFKVTLDVLGLDVLGLDVLVLDVLGEHVSPHPTPNRGLGTDVLNWSRHFGKF
jgi:hypothetical protein